MRKNILRTRFFLQFSAKITDFFREKMPEVKTEKRKIPLTRAHNNM